MAEENGKKRGRFGDGIKNQLIIFPMSFWVFVISLCEVRLGGGGRVDYCSWRSQMAPLKCNSHITISAIKDSDISLWLISISSGYCRWSLGGGVLLGFQ